jgi:hypothetical protein
VRGGVERGDALGAAGLDREAEVEHQGDGVGCARRGRPHKRGAPVVVEACG